MISTDNIATHKVDALLHLLIRLDASNRDADVFQHLFERVCNSLLSLLSSAMMKCKKGRDVIFRSTNPFRGMAKRFMGV